MSIGSKIIGNQNPSKIMQKYIDTYKNLYNWVKKSDFKGFDPYDIKSLPWIVFLTKKGNKHYLVNVFKEFLFELFYSFPYIFRFVFRVKKNHNPKAFGLIAQSNLQFYQFSNDEFYLQESIKCIQWLDSKKIIIGEGVGWGYPFDWQSTELIPKYTPNGIVTTVAGDAYWSMYKQIGDKAYLNTCIAISNFLITLPFDRLDDKRLCFAYTPVFQNHVHNLNLFIAEFIIKVGIEIDNPEYVHMGNCALNYSLSNQREDGSFDYNGPPEKPNNFVDNYHTGFVLRMLHSIWKITGRKDVYQALSRCYAHYTSNFFEDNQIPKLMPNKKYRIDIHSCAESINCLSELSVTFPEGLQLAERILDWTIDNLYDKKGYFYYGILKSRFTGLPFKSKIAYLRWGQAWMLKALSSFLLTKRIINQ